MTLDEWKILGLTLYGADQMNWKFQCPCCGFVQTANDYRSAGSPEGAVAFSCVGRWSGAKREAFGEGEGPCNYSGGGLFRMHKLTVAGRAVFEFADKDGSPKLALPQECK